VSGYLVVVMELLPASCEKPTCRTSGAARLLPGPSTGIAGGRDSLSRGCRSVDRQGGGVFDLDCLQVVGVQAEQAEDGGGPATS